MIKQIIWLKSMIAYLKYLHKLVNKNTVHYKSLLDDCGARNYNKMWEGGE